MVMMLCFTMIGSWFGSYQMKAAQEGEASVTDLGVMFPQSVTLMTSAFGVEQGADVMYTVVAGTPSIFVTVDVKTGQVKRHMELPDSGGSWTQTVDAIGNVYIGTYGNGILFKFDPSTETLTNLGTAVPGETFLYGLVPGNNGKIYGGTYPNGKLFEYDSLTNQFTDFGTMVPGEVYVRSVAFDPETNKVYAGIGSHAHLIEYDLSTGTKKNILPSEHMNVPYIYDLNWVNGKLFARKDKSNSMLVIDLKTYEVLNELPMNSRGISAKSPVANKIYYTFNYVLHEYDLDTNTARSLGLTAAGNSAVSYAFVDLQDPNNPGYTLYGLSGNRGGVYRYNLETGKMSSIRLVLPGSAKDINSVVNGPDGKIHMGGFLTGGGITSYNPVNGAVVKNPGLSQVEGFGVLGDKIYAGVYPGARLYEYDPVTLKATLVSDLGVHGQDRPYAVLGLKKDNKVAIGTLAGYGMLEGALSIYDRTTKETQVYKNIVRNQSVISLAQTDGMLYGGTTVYGGLGSQDPPPEKEAKLFIFDPLSGQKVFETVPVPGATSITSIIVGPDDKLWGFANGTLFVFDPTSRNVQYADAKFPYGGGREWRNVSLTIGTDGNVYGLHNGSRKFFKLDAVSKEMTVLNNDARTGLAQDDFGSFYFSRGTNLIKYTDPALLLQYSGKLKLITEKKDLQPGQTLKLILEAGLEKGRETRNLTGAVVQYWTSDPTVATVENGVVSGLSEGVVQVWATAGLPDGTVAESQKLTIRVTKSIQPY
jgi:streptogramin lyase